MSIARARNLRKNPTEAEKHLWRRVRRRQLDGFRFRRQQPIGPYIVDFFCPDAKLVIELDGGQHTGQAAADAMRTEWLENRGYRVLRFWNNDIFDNADGTIETIRSALRTS